MAIRVIQIGLGPIGAQLSSRLLENEDLELVAAFDIDPEKAGRDVGELAGTGRCGIRILPWEKAPADLGAEVAVVSTVSSLRSAAPQVLELVSRGLHVVSTCEELTHPWRTAPSLAEEIDSRARERSVAVLGTGINPGFLMDFLPAIATGVCRRVDRVRVERIQDAGLRRGPFQEKVGAGLTVEEFERRAGLGKIRHVGLTESMHLLAEALNWALERTEDEVRPVIAQAPTPRGDATIPVGGVLGVDQTGRGYIGDEEVLTLAFRAAIAEPSPRDSVEIQGDPSLRLEIPGGVNGDIGTCSMVINAISRMPSARPGLRTMLDIGAISCRSGRAVSSVGL